MTTMQTGVDFQSFDMWHDYMNLNRLLLGDRRPVEPEEPSKEPFLQMRHIQASLAGKKWKSSSESSSTSSGGTSADVCRFCRQNGESPQVYRSHALKSDDGRVTCPVLRSYTCPICGATGDNTHTRSYCPKGKLEKAAGAREQPVLLKFW